MLQSLVSDQERREDEISSLSSICDQNEFSYYTADTIRCRCTIFPDICKLLLDIKDVDKGDEKLPTDLSSDKCSVEFLPPIRLYLQLPNDYPSKSPPNFYLSISWIPPWETSLICQKLDEIWQENRGNEILFLWLDFLRNDLRNFLQIKETLDVSFLYNVYTAPQDYYKSNLRLLSDPRAMNHALHLNPIQFLTNYSNDQRKVEFEKKFYTCPVCFEEYGGYMCMELKNCGHVYCKECMQQYITFKINEGMVKSLLCPDWNCTMEIMVHEIKNACPNLFSKYEELMLRVTLSTMSDIVFCPRVWCQNPVIRDLEDTLAICSKCKYSFCTYCQKVYHGVAPCAMTSSDTVKLINDYKNGDFKFKKLLEERYGRKQIQAVVENHLTKEYLKDNAKPCPNCQTQISKIDGCNKMMCTRCEASFCWLCGKHIMEQDAYSHFRVNDSTCYGRLFEGSIDVGFNDIDDIDIVENILWFNEQHANIL